MIPRTPVGLSAMHYQHVGLGAVMVEADGWQCPIRYGSVEEELEQVRQGVGLCDVSPTGKLLLQGEAIDDMLGAGFPKLGTLNVGDARAQSLKIGSAPGSRHRPWALAFSFSSLMIGSTTQRFS